MMKFFSIFFGVFSLAESSDRVPRLVEIVRSVVQDPPMDPIAHISLIRSNQRRDIRPYVKVSFLMEGPDMMGYSALFQTSSSVSYARAWTSKKRGLPVYSPEPGEIALRPAKFGEGYLNRDFEILSPSCRYLAIGERIVAESNCTVSEYACIFSGNETFAFPIALDLIQKFDGPSETHVPDFLIGASPSSDFALYAGVFILADASRELFIGDEIVDMVEALCRDSKKFSFVPITNEPDAWIIHGYIGGHEVLLELTTGAHSIHHQLQVPSAILEMTTRILESHGAVQSAVNGMFSSCNSEAIASLPSIDLEFGRVEGESVIITFHPAEYVVYQKFAHRCMLLLSAQTANTIIVGPEILNKLVTVFDARKKRVGICLANIQ